MSTVIGKAIRVANVSVFDDGDLLCCVDHDLGVFSHHKFISFMRSPIGEFSDEEINEELRVLGHEHAGEFDYWVVGSSSKKDLKAVVHFADTFGCDLDVTRAEKKAGHSRSLPLFRTAV